MSGKLCLSEGLQGRKGLGNGRYGAGYSSSELMIKGDTSYSPEVRDAGGD